MFKKACYFDEDTVFYFDSSDIKWIAQGGSIAWRTNNPGLLQTHQLIRSTSISHHHRIAIFSSEKAGIAALYLWLLEGDFKSKYLFQIAKHLQPESPQSCLDQLCSFTGLSENFLRSQMTGEILTSLAGAIKKLFGFDKFQDKKFIRLPRILVRYYSEDKQVDHYLTNENNFLIKSEAITWVEEHRLDAVIVRKKNGNLYLRARPGHHFDRIKMSSEEYGKEHDFDHAIRDVGIFQDGQCIWGYINGIWNFESDAKESTQMISNMARNQKVWSLISNWSILDDSGITQCVEQLCDIETQIVKNAAGFFRLLLELSQQDSKKPPVVIFLHSQGALIGDLALNLLSEDERKQIRIFTFGGARMLPPGKAHQESHNYISLFDAIPKQSLEGELAAEIFGGSKRGLTQREALDQMIQEKLNRLLDTNDVNTWSVEREKYFAKYMPIFPLLINVTVLDEKKKKIPLEHCIDALCYKNKLEEIVKKYMDIAVSQEEKIISELVLST